MDRCLLDGIYCVDAILKYMPLKGIPVRKTIDGSRVDLVSSFKQFLIRRDYPGPDSSYFKFSNNVFCT